MRGFHMQFKSRSKCEFNWFHSFADRKKCILIGHDWGATIGFEFLSKYKHMVDKYVMMGGPSLRVFNELVLTTLDQFKRSSYIFVFQMPILPEKLLSAVDYGIFYDIRNRKFNDNFTKEDLEAYKYVYSKPG